MTNINMSIVYLFYKVLVILKIKVALINCSWSKAPSKAAKNNGLIVVIGRSPRRRFPDHAFMPHCTFFPHLLAQQAVRRAPEGEGALAGGIWCNFANIGPRNSIQLLIWYAMCWKCQYWCQFPITQTQDIFSLVDAAWKHAKYPCFCTLPLEFEVNIDIHKHESS